MSTSPARPQLGRFEQRLLAELTNVVAERANPTTAALSSAASPTRRPAWRRPVVRLVAAAVVAAALAVGLPGMLDHTSGTPAYAVVRHPDGSVTVTVDDIGASGEATRRLADQLQRQLTHSGVRNRVFLVAYQQIRSCRFSRRELPPAGLFTRPRPSDPPPARSRRGHGYAWTVFTIHPDKLPTGATVVITIANGPGPRQGAILLEATTHPRPHTCSTR